MVRVSFGKTNENSGHKYHGESEREAVRAADDASASLPTM